MVHFYIQFALDVLESKSLESNCKSKAPKPVPLIVSGNDYFLSHGVGNLSWKNEPQLTRAAKPMKIRPINAALGKGYNFDCSNELSSISFLSISPITSPFTHSPCSPAGDILRGKSQSLSLGSLKTCVSRRGRINLPLTRTLPKYVLLGLC